MQKLLNVGLLLLIAAVFAGCPSGADKTQTSDKATKTAKDKGKAAVKDGASKATADEPSIDTSAGDALMNLDAAKWGPDSLETVKNYSLYREFYKQKSYDDAIPYWRYVFKNAPAARKTPLLNGEKMYKHYIDQEITATVCEKGEVEGKNKKGCKDEDKGKFKGWKFKDEAKVTALMDTIGMIYEARKTHFGEEGFVNTLNYRLLKDYKPGETAKLDALCEKAVEADQEFLAYDVMWAHFATLIKKYKAQTFNAQQLIAAYEPLEEVVDFNVNNNEDNSEKMIGVYQKYGDKMSGIMQKVIDAEDARDEAQAAATERANVKDCPSVKEFYGAKYNAAPNDLAILKTYYSKLKRAGCTKDPEYTKLLMKWNELEPSASRTRIIAQTYQKNKDYSSAKTYYKKSLDLESDPSKKAKVYMRLAKIAQAADKDYGQARTYAQKAIQADPGTGAPYMLIGDLYASSAGRLKSDGVNGRTVYYVAVDMYRKAADVDPGVSSKAKEKIGKYSAAFPSQDDKTNYFMQKSKNFPAVGSSISVGGWIGQRTTVK